MIKLLANLGRFKTVAVITLIAAILSTICTVLGATYLSREGMDVNFELAIWFAVYVPLFVTPLLSWHLIGMLLKIYRMEEEMRQLASHDSLTGLLSRHAFFESANSYVSLALRDQRPYSVAIVDLDYFKSINDQHGHPAGDAVLKLFADVLNSVSRRSDIIGRLGGEEFALILPSTTAAEAYEFSGRLHNAIGKAVLKYKDVIIQYTASIGLASYEPGSEDTVDTLLARADEALYQAKAAGRNQTAVYSDEEEQIIA